MSAKGFINLEWGFIVPAVQFALQPTVIKKLCVKIYDRSDIKIKQKTIQCALRMPARCQLLF